MSSLVKYISLLLVASTYTFALALPQGNSYCAHWCHDNYESCGFKNVGECVSNAAHNDFDCGCPAEWPDW